MPLFYTLRRSMRYLYLSQEKLPVHYRMAILGFDIIMLVYIIMSSFFYGNDVVEVLDIFFGIIVLMELCARLLVKRRILSELLSPFNLADIVVAASLLLPLVGENLAFFRILRIFRIFKYYNILDYLEKKTILFRRYHDVTKSIINLMVFIFVMTALIFETQVRINPNIRNYLDALYFTVTTLTTTGFGDITLVGNSGRLLSVVTMIFGVSLFFRLAQTIIRPFKVRYECPHCALYLHDRDAVHCKHCGERLAIPDDGLE